jgi:autotransporter-associated beta strand protein
MRRIFILSLLSILSCELFAQQNVFHRSDAGTNNWWDGSNPWYRECDGWWINRPDRSECNNGTTIGPNNIFIGHNNNTAMNVNGALFQVRAFTLQATATSARTFNDGGEISLSVGIYNESTGNHVFNVPIHVDAATVDFQANSGNLSFTTDFILNANVAAITGSNNITISGVMSGVNGGISKSGTGSLFLTNTNTYTGSTTISAGTLELQGSIASSAVTVSGGTLRINGDNVTVASLTVEAGGTVEIEVGKSLTVSGAFSNSGTFTIKSDATGTGSLINSTAGVAATVQRYVVSHGNIATDGWHLMGSPVATFNINGSSFDPGASDDLYSWDEATNTWLNHKAGNPTQIVPGTGYIVAYENTGTKNFSGNLNNDDVIVNSLTRTVGVYTDPDDAGFNLVGNPFPSAIKWNDGNWTLTNISTTAKVWNSTDKSYTDLGENGIIPAMNGFFVQLTSGTTGSITIPNDSRVHDVTAWYKSSETGSFKLIAREADNSSAQSSYIRINSNAGTSFDPMIDAAFLPGYAPLFYSLKGESRLSTYAIAETNEETVIPYGFVSNGAEVFELELAESIEGKTIYLTDLKLNIKTNLTQEGSYSFTSAEGDDPNRFLLHFGAVGVDEAIPATAVAAYVSNNILYVLNAQGKVQVDVLDISGRMVHSQSVQAEGLSSTPLKLPAGVYVVRLNDGQTSRTNKVIVQ